jgi:hypothetical protein
MSDDRLKILEERLMRLEAAMAQQPAARPGVTFPGGAVVDPAPNPGGWGYPRPRPVVDPAPWPWWGGHPHWPPYIVDPAPWPPSPVVDPAPWPNPIVDPAVSIERMRATAAASFARIGPSVDPAPIDISRFTVSQLESSLHTINAERSRLDSMEVMIKQQLDNLRQQKDG